MHPNAGLLMEAEIRKLKMALIKEELNDKMKSFRAYMERMRNTTTPAPAPVEVVRPFDSILFMNVTGDFEVWHFVMLLFFAWFFLSKLNFNPNTPLYQKAIIKIWFVLIVVVIHYTRKLYYYTKWRCNRRRRRLNNFRRLKEKHLEYEMNKSSQNLYSDLPMKVSDSIKVYSYPPLPPLEHEEERNRTETNGTFEYDYNRDSSERPASGIQVATISYPPLAPPLPPPKPPLPPKPPKPMISREEEEEAPTVSEKSTGSNNDTFEFDYTPPKGSFFLYTIHEHQMLTNKTFGYKKKLYNSFLSGNLSKSDSNICKSIGTDNKSFI